ncbi:hypothetical protein EXE47_14900 [Halorubrum sp. GN12_10-3_MGM]|nr:hypothetical protein EXE47_14900 [Halorubrum sp. GN12_10-3_MGM]
MAAVVATTVERTPPDVCAPNHLAPLRPDLARSIRLLSLSHRLIRSTTCSAPPPDPFDYSVRSSDSKMNSSIASRVSSGASS